MARTTSALVEQAAGEPEKLFRVVDLASTERGVAKTHDLGGVDYELAPKIGAQVPWEAARHVAGNPDFKVVDPDGVEVRPVRKDSRSGEVVLLSNECVAAYEELAPAALLRRVRAVDGGDVFTHSSERDKMIAHLVEVALKEEAARKRLETRPVRRDETGALILYTDEEA